MGISLLEEVYSEEPHLVQLRVEVYSVKEIRVHQGQLEVEAVFLDQNLLPHLEVVDYLEVVLDLLSHRHHYLVEIKLSQNPLISLLVACSAPLLVLVKEFLSELE